MNMIELAKQGTEKAFEIVEEWSRDFVNSGLMTQDEADFEEDKAKKIIIADEKKIKAKRYAKLTKKELKLKAKND